MGSASDGASTVSEAPSWMPNRATKWNRLPLPGSLSSQSRPAHHLHELRANRQTQPASSVPSCGRCVDLHERPEDLPLFVVGNADAGVAHGDLQHHLLVGALSDNDLDPNLAGVGELHGVADEIQHDLSQTSRIAHDDGGHVRRNAAGQLQPFLLGATRQQVDAALDRVAKNERDALECQTTRLDLRHVEDVVDDRHQGFGRVLRRLDVVALVPGQLRLQREIGHADDCVHRRADLMAHVREEVALGGSRGLGTRAGDLELRSDRLSALSAAFRSVTSRAP
jgi:hypothetical protein